MPEEKQAPEAAQVDAEMVSELQAKIAEQAALIESVKAAQKGSDSKASAVLAENAELKKQLEERMSDSEKLSFEQQKKEAEFQAMKESLEQFKAEKVAQDFRDAKTKILQESGLNDISLIDTLAGSNIEDFSKSVEWYKNTLATTEGEVKKTIMNGKEPEGGKRPLSSITREDFNKLSYMERVRLATDDPETYKKYAN